MTSTELPTALPTSDRRRYRPTMAWTVLVLLMIFTVINYADRTVLALAARPIMEDLGISASHFGLISSSFFFLFSVSAIGVGFAASRVSLKWILFSLSLVWLASQLPVFLFATGTVLLGTRITLGAAEGPAQPMANSVAFTWFPAHRRGLPSSLLSSGASIAKILVAPILTLIIVHVGWRYGFLFLAVAGGLWCLVWLVVGKEGPYATSRKADAESTPESCSAAKEERRLTFRRAVLNRTFFSLLVATAPMYALITVVISWMPAYLEAGLGFSRIQSGFLYSLPSIASLVFMISAGVITDRLLRRGTTARVARGIVPAVALILAGLLVGMLPMLQGRSPYVTLAALVVGYGLGNIAMPLVYAAIGTLAAAEQRAVVLSLFIGLQSLAGVIAPWFTGILIDHGDTPVAGYNTAFAVLGVLNVVGGIVALILANPDRDNIAERP